MRSFVFYAVIEPGDRRGVVVSFPDVPEAITQADDIVEARTMAEEALGLALLTYPARGLPLPKAKARGHDMVAVAVAPDIAAKLAVLQAFTEAKITKIELARRLGKDEKEVRRILDPKHATKLVDLDRGAPCARQAPGRRGGEGGLTT
jgi:antitoxin HicB